MLAENCLKLRFKRVSDHMLSCEPMSGSHIHTQTSMHVVVANFFHSISKFSAQKEFLNTGNKQNTLKKEKQKRLENKNI